MNDNTRVSPACKFWNLFYILYDSRAVKHLPCIFNLSNWFVFAAKIVMFKYWAQGHLVPEETHWMCVDVLMSTGVFHNVGLGRPSIVKPNLYTQEKNFWKSQEEGCQFIYSICHLFIYLCPSILLFVVCSPLCHGFVFPQVRVVLPKDLRKILVSLIVKIYSFPAPLLFFLPLTNLIPHHSIKWSFKRYN